MCRRAIALSVSFGLLFAGAIAGPLEAQAQAAGPPADYKIVPKHTSTSPDGKTTIEQYAKIDAGGDYTWQFWARRQGKLTMLEPEQPDYAAGFRFTNDSQWLVRMQKTGSGEASLYLYRLMLWTAPALRHQSAKGWLRCSKPH